MNKPLHVHLQIILCPVLFLNLNAPLDNVERKQNIYSHFIVMQMTLPATDESSECFTLLYMSIFF